METPTLTIKLKGTQALQALASKSAPVIGKAASVAAPVEGARWIAAGKGGASKSVAALKTASVATAKTTALANTATLPSAGTIWSGTGLSLGLGLGLGALGPALLLGALGLTATGIYLYWRGRAEPHEHSEDDVAPPIASTETAPA